MTPERPDAVPQGVWARVQSALDAVEREERVAILFAVESGSRAWGFASPDSDWDVRFAYARPTAWHLTLEPGRDVIERALPGDLDLAGWDARKSLNLLLSGNAALREWLRSPILYRAEPGALAALRALADSLPARAAAWHHYRSLGRKQEARAFAAANTVRLKRYLYMLRPALALRWMRHRAEGTPPMDLPTLLAEAPTSAVERAEIDRLLAAKSQASEMGEGPRVPVLDALIAEEIAAPPPSQSPKPSDSQRAEAQALFRRLTALADARFPE